MLAKASIELNQEAGTVPKGLDKSTRSSTHRIPMFQIIM